MNNDDGVVDLKSRRSDLVTPVYLNHNDSRKDSSMDATKISGADGRNNNYNGILYSELNMTHPFSEANLHVSPGQNFLVDQDSSYTSGSYLMASHKTNLDRTNIAIRVTSFVQAAAHLTQLFFFAMLLNDVYNCDSNYALLVMLNIVGGVGTLFGLWGVFVNYLSTKRRIIATAAIGTGLLSVNFILTLLWVLYNTDEELGVCTSYRDSALLSVTLLSSILLLVLFLQIVNVILTWSVIRNKKSLKILEGQEQARQALLSQVARDLSMA